ncbi:MAG: hypothetical protein HY824_12650 [Acidobacteria bacterium]|nr:hypothetical protein [Acidobacteriota bacterium]
MNKVTLKLACLAVAAALSRPALAPAFAQSAAGAPAGPRAISGAPSGALHCVSGSATNVHNLGWLAAGGQYTITFDSGVALTTAIARLDLSQSISSTIRGNPDFNFTASSSGTMALHVASNGQPGCYRYQVLMDPPASTTAGAARALEPATPLREIPRASQAASVGPLTISGTPSSAYHCVAGTLRPNVHEIGRVERNSTVSVSFDNDFTAVAAATMISLEPGATGGSFVIDDDASGRPALSFQAAAGSNVVLYVAGAGGSIGCYRYQVQIR